MGAKVSGYSDFLLRLKILLIELKIFGLVLFMECESVVTTHNMN